MYLLMLDVRCYDLIYWHGEMYFLAYYLLYLPPVACLSSSFHLPSLLCFLSFALSSPFINIVIIFVRERDVLW